MGHPSGTVTLLFTDIEGSTRLWERDPQAMDRAVKRHDTLLRRAIESSGGYVFKTVGDAFCAAFTTAQAGIEAAVAGQRALGCEEWTDLVPIRVRMSLHTGVCQERDGDYFGPAVNRTARLEAVAHGGQVVLSRATAELVQDVLPKGASLRDLGEHRLKDLSRPEWIFQLDVEGLAVEFPPLRSLTYRHAPLFSVLGPLRVEHPDREIRIGGARRRNVLVRLLSSPNQVVSTDVLAEDVWDGAPPSAAASTLQSHVSALRQLLGPDRLSFREGGYCLAVEAVELDATVFEADVACGRAAVAQGDLATGLQALERGLARWRGVPFADAAGAGWTLIPTARLEEERNAAIEDALEVRLELGLHHEVCALADEAVAVEPFRERRWAALMLALYRSGRQAEALRCYQRARDKLGEELGLQPSPELVRLEHDILLQSEDLAWRGSAEAVTAVPALAAPPADDTSRTNLPAPVSGFIGRERELAELDKLLGAHRLVSVVGTGGIGKTRLAIEVAGSRVDQCRDGVWFVDLTKLSEPGGIAGAIAQAIGVTSASDEPLATVLVEQVKDLDALVVLDNCEHLVDDVAALVEELLEAGPALRALTTSREPLRVPGEVVWQTPPIATPDDPADLDAPALSDFDGVRLFVERAAEAMGGRQPELGELRLVAEIVAKLDGLPLAIELAAARVPTLGLRQLGSLLHDRLGLLGGGSRAARKRHQTLLATVDWSYRLLPDDLRATLRRLSVFVGGFTIEAAEAVAPTDGDTAEEVVFLAERSLLVADLSAATTSLSPGMARYRMLETIRQFAADRLVEEEGPKADTDTREAHSRYFAQLAARAAGPLVGWHQGRWLTALELEHGNLSAAIAHLLAQPDRVADGIRMIVQLHRFWFNRNHLEECSALLQRGLEVAGDRLDPELRSAALTMSGRAAAPDAAASDFSEALRTARTAGDDGETAQALWGLAWVSFAKGDLVAGRAAGREAVELARRTGDLVCLGECLVSYGLTSADDLSLCRSIHEEAIQVTSRSGDRVYLAWAHNNFGNGLLANEEWAEAREHLESARAIFEEIGWVQPIPVHNLGWVYVHQGDLDGAVDAFSEALRMSRRVHLRREQAYSVLGLACSAVAGKDWPRAAALVGFADAELETRAEAWTEPERTYRDHALAEVTTNLGHRADTLYDSGRVRDRDEMLEVALGRAMP
jgi:predicted ATPase/class 3 adenylate cyclase/DNA-binding SARP family transcriptional activator/Tfp pilus assembly protein PilF